MDRDVMVDQMPACWSTVQLACLLFTIFTCPSSFYFCPHLSRHSRIDYCHGPSQFRNWTIQPSVARVPLICESPLCSESALFFLPSSSPLVTLCIRFWALILIRAALSGIKPPFSRPLTLCVTFASHWAFIEHSFCLVPLVGLFPTHFWGMNSVLARCQAPARPLFHSGLQGVVCRKQVARRRGGRGMERESSRLGEIGRVRDRRAEERTSEAMCTFIHSLSALLSFTRLLISLTTTDNRSSPTDCISSIHNSVPLNSWLITDSCLLFFFFFPSLFHLFSSQFRCHFRPLLTASWYISPCFSLIIDRFPTNYHFVRVLGCVPASTPPHNSSSAPGNFVYRSIGSSYRTLSRATVTPLNHGGTGSEDCLLQVLPAHTPHHGLVRWFTNWKVIQFHRRCVESIRKLSSSFKTFKNFNYWLISSQRDVFVRR